MSLFYACMAVHRHAMSGYLTISFFYASCAVHIYHKMNECLTISLFYACLAVHVIHAYKPVMFMHGIFSHAQEADKLFQWIKQVGSAKFCIHRKLIN